MQKIVTLMPEALSPCRLECNVVLVPAYLALRRELIRLRAELAEFEFQLEVVLGPLKAQADALHRQITLLESYISLRDAGLSVAEAAETLRNLFGRASADRSSTDHRLLFDADNLPRDERQALKQAFRHVIRITHPDVVARNQTPWLIRGIDPLEYLADAVEARVRGDLDRLIAINTVLDWQASSQPGEYGALSLEMSPWVKARHLRRAIAGLQQERQALLNSDLAQLRQQVLHSGHLDPIWQEKLVAQQEFTLTVASGKLAHLEIQLLRLGHEDAPAVGALLKEQGL